MMHIRCNELITFPVDSLNMTEYIVELKMNLAIWSN